MRTVLRAVGIAALLLPALGCLPLPGAGTPQTVQVQNSATVQARVRIGPFRAGGADVPEDKMIAEQLIPPKGTHTFSIPTGRYNIEAVAITQKTETATSNFTLTADRPVSLRLHETLVDSTPILRPSESPPPVQQAERLRQLSWVEL